MGVYYKLVNRQKRQRIEPSRLGAGGIKWGAMVHGDSAHLLMFCHLRGDTGWTVLSDGTDEYFDIEDQYEDVTESVVTAFNDEVKGMHFTPRRGPQIKTRADEGRPR